MMRTLTWTAATGSKGKGGTATRHGSTGRGLLQRQEQRAAEPQVQFSLRALKGGSDEEQSGPSGHKSALGRTPSLKGDEQAQPQQAQLGRDTTSQQPSENDAWAQQQQQMLQQGHQFMAAGIPAGHGYAAEGDAPWQETPLNVAHGEAGVPEAGLPGQARPFASKRAANTADNISTYEHGSTQGAPPPQTQAQMQFPMSESLTSVHMEQQPQVQSAEFPRPRREGNMEAGAVQNAHGMLDRASTEQGAVAQVPGGGGWEAVALLATQSQGAGEEEAQAWQGTEPLTPGRRSGGEEKDGGGGGHLESVLLLKFLY